MALNAAGSRQETRDRILTHLKNLHLLSPDRPGISIPEMAQEIEKSVGYVRIILTELEAEGQVKRDRRPHGEDRRVLIWTYDPTQGRTP